MQSKVVTIRKKHTQLENYENIWIFFLALFVSYGLGLYVRVCARSTCCLMINCGFDINMHD